MFLLLISALVGCSYVAKVGTGKVVIPSERDAKWKNAKCNDGTPFGITVDKPEAKSNVWVIKVGGGGFCDNDRVKCENRKDLLTTGMGKKDGEMTPMMHLGLHSRSQKINPDFYNANHVILNYCSSDFWVGESTKRQPTAASSKGWFFSGRKNFDAAMGTLEQKVGMADGNAKILIAGHSAGGMGVVANVQSVKKHFPKSIKQGDLKIIIDGSWMPTPDDSTGYPAWNKWGDLHKGCTRTAEKKKTGTENCYYGPNWYPYMKKTGIPILIQQSTVDPTAKKVFRYEGPEETKKFHAMCKSSFKGVEWLYSGSHIYHTTLFDEQFIQGDKGKTLQNVIHRFWTDKKPERVFYDNG